VQSVKPNPKIIATWSDAEKKIIEFHLYKNVKEKKGDEYNTAEEVEILGEHYKYKRIEDYKNGDFQKLEKALILKQKFVGAEDPTEDWDDIIEFMQDEFPDISISEINQAFSMAIGGKLPIDKIDSVRFFTPVLIARILNAYKEKRSEVIMKYRKGEDEVASELIAQSKKELADQNEDLIMRNVCIGAFHNYKQEVPFVAVTPIYEFLVKEGILILTEERLKEYDKRATQSLKMKSVKDKKLRSIINNLKEETDCNQEYNMFKQDDKHAMIIREFFGGLVEMEQELHELFENKQLKPKNQRPLIDTTVKSKRKKN
jgi:hypothetical protein